MSHFQSTPREKVPFVFSPFKFWSKSADKIESVEKTEKAEYIESVASNQAEEEDELPAVVEPEDEKNPAAAKPENRKRWTSDVTVEISKADDEHCNEDKREEQPSTNSIEPSPVFHKVEKYQAKPTYSRFSSASSKNSVISKEKRTLDKSAFQRGRYRSIPQSQPIYGRNSANSKTSTQEYSSQQFRSNAGCMDRRISCEQDLKNRGARCIKPFFGYKLPDLCFADSPEPRPFRPTIDCRKCTPTIYTISKYRRQPRADVNSNDRFQNYNDPDNYNQGYTSDATEEEYGEEEEEQRSLEYGDQDLDRRTVYETEKHSSSFDFGNHSSSRHHHKRHHKDPCRDHRNPCERKMDLSDFCDHEFYVDFCDAFMMPGEFENFFKLNKRTSHSRSHRRRH